MLFKIKRMKIPSFLTMMMMTSTDWKPTSWSTQSSLQIPTYPDPLHLEKIKDQLKTKPPLVFAGEIRNLREQLTEVQKGEAFLFQGGPCAETFLQCEVNEIKRLFSLMIQTSLILGYGLEKKIVRIGRLGGQYAKPRSQPFEQDGTTLTFRGDIIHSLEDRSPKPERMLEAFYHSLATLNCVRSFAKSGDLDISSLEDWISSTPYGSNQKQFVENIRKSVSMMKNMGLIPEKSPMIREPDFFLSHEGLLLHYEEAMTRCEESSGDYYNCGAHTIWLGERTRNSQAHLEYLRGIENPIGIKIGPDCTPQEMLQTIQHLNPTNEWGKIMLIFRMGKDHIRESLPSLLEILSDSELKVALLCDPCHANTFQINGYKTRLLKDMMQEISFFFSICADKNLYAGGVHLEISGSPVTECIGDSIQSADLASNYQTTVDPRLNNEQTLATAFFIASIGNTVTRNMLKEKDTL